jgi:hypothetical protein
MIGTRSVLAGVAVIVWLFPAATLAQSTVGGPFNPLREPPPMPNPAITGDANDAKYLNAETDDPIAACAKHLGPTSTSAPRCQRTYFDKSAIEKMPVLRRGPDQQQPVQDRMRASLLHGQRQ